MGFDIKAFLLGSSPEVKEAAKAALAEEKPQEDNAAQATADPVVDQTVDPVVAPAPVADAANPNAHMEALLTQMTTMLGAIDSRLTALESASVVTEQSEATENAPEPEAVVTAGQVWAAGAVQGAYILPFQARSYANAYDKLAEICAGAAEMGAESDFQVELADGSHQSLAEAFASAIAPSVAPSLHSDGSANNSFAESDPDSAAAKAAAQRHGYLSPVAMQAMAKDGKITQARLKTEEKIGDGMRIMSEDEIDALASAALGVQSKRKK